MNLAKDFHVLTWGYKNNIYPDPSAEGWVKDNGECVFCKRCDDIKYALKEARNYAVCLSIQLEAEGCSVFMSNRDAIWTEETQ